MELGPHVAEWVELRKRLRALATQCDAENVYVLDTQATVWCAAQPYNWSSEYLVVQATRQVVGSLRRPLHRGGSIDQVVEARASILYMKSFASIYVLLVRFATTPNEEMVRSEVASALPQVERLTVALPPPDGPGSGTAEGYGVA